MHIIITQNVDIDPRNRIEYIFRFETSLKTLENYRVVRWNRRAKNARRWKGFDDDPNNVPDQVREAALKEAHQRLRAMSW